MEDVLMACKLAPAHGRRFSIPDRLTRAAAAAACLVALITPAPAQAYDDAGYLNFTDRVAAQLEPAWSPADGYYLSGSPALDSRFNAAMLLVHATAARYGHAGASRNDERARRLAQVLTASPPFFSGAAAPWPDPMFHSPGWVGNLIPGYSVMDKAIDPKIAEGLFAAWQARDALALPQETSAAIVQEISAVAHGAFFRFPNVRLNQINWPLEMAAYDALTTGHGELLRDEYRLQVARFLEGARADTNLSPSYRFHYVPRVSAARAINLDSAEYANITLHFLAFYDDARRAGMPEPPAADVRLLRAWVQRALFGYWTHAGLLNWDTGLGMKRWMKGKTWAYAQQGLLAMASASRFQRDARSRRWAKAMFDRGLSAYRRMEGAGRPPPSNLYGVAARRRTYSDDVMFAARMAGNAARAAAAGLGRVPAAEPPPFYAFDADVGRLAVSTPAYSTAIVAVNRRAFPYGGIELARLFDRRGQPVTGIGGRPPAALGVVVRDRSARTVLASQEGRRRDPARPPVILTRSPQGRVTRLERLPAHPAAGPFRTLQAVGRRRAGRFDITTRHTFRRAAIDERWTVRRHGGRGFYSAVVQLPTWGAAASATAVRHKRGNVPLEIGGAPIPLDDVRGFRIRGPVSSYSAALLGRARGTVRLVPTLAESANPDPGPTLELTIASGTRFKRARLDLRIVPRATPLPSTHHALLIGRTAAP